MYRIKVRNQAVCLFPCLLPCCCLPPEIKQKENIFIYDLILKIIFYVLYL
ncbi:hypothetical protein CBFG_04061 [Clostridiales bacterium 1_7_47FAA]|nr:hypothetical protein CBFG_04061 [Clostridiales bacterium 1_7_47FAA]